MLLPLNHFPSIKYVRPPCPICGVLMLLARIDSVTSDHDKRMFECFLCDRSESVVVRRAT